MPKPLDPTGLAGAFSKKGPPSALDFLVPQRRPAPPPAPPPAPVVVTPKPKAKAKTPKKPKTPKAKTPKARKTKTPRTRRRKKAAEPEPITIRDTSWSPTAPVPRRAGVVRRVVRRVASVPVRVVAKVVGCVL